MLRTYEGVLKDGRIDWRDDAPPSGKPLRVHVTVLADEGSDERRGARMAEALASLAASGGVQSIPDPSAWQREIRSERPLPGRRD